MALKKVAPSAFWTTGAKGVSPEAVGWVYAAGSDTYTLTVGSETDGDFEADSNGDRTFTPGASTRRTKKVGTIIRIT